MRLLHAVGLAGALLLGIALIAGAQESPAAWTVGSRVHAGSAVCARATPVASAPCGTLEPAGTKGTIRAGPVTDAAVVFWSVAFDGSVTGWARQLYLTLDTLGVPNPPPPPPPPGTAIVGVIVGPAFLTEFVGDSAQYSAFAVRGDGTLGFCTPSWTSTTAAVATVSPTGLAHFLAPGADTLVATCPGSGGTTVSGRGALMVSGWGAPVAFDFLGVRQLLYPGPHIYTARDSTGKIVARAYVTVVLVP